MYPCQNPVLYWLVVLVFLNAWVMPGFMRHFLLPKDSRLYSSIGNGFARCNAAYNSVREKEIRHVDF